MESKKEVIVRLYPELFHLSEDGNMYFIDKGVSTDPMDVEVDLGSGECNIQSIYSIPDRDNNLSMWLGSHSGGILNIIDYTNIQTDTIIRLFGYNIDLSYCKDTNLNEFVKLDRQAILRTLTIQDIIEC